MSSETMKFSFHHRAFYCYLVMSLWILIAVASMYKYVGPGEEEGILKKNSHSISKVDSEIKKIISSHCVPADEIRKGSEGAPSPARWRLESVLVATRHGDRGPLAHARGGHALPCNTVPQDPLLQSYSEFVWNATAGGRAVWTQAPGPFHNFPTLPVRTAATSCALGQLTMNGVLQMLKVGTIIKEAYAERLGWSDKDNFKNGQLVTYSTRYRRTFQSALAVLFAMMPRAAFPRQAGALREAHSVTFCFRDCVCPHADTLARKLWTEARKRLELRPEILELVKNMSEIVLESQERVEPGVVADALLASVCHAAALPCREPPAPARTKRDVHKLQLDFDTQMEKEKLQYYRQRYMQRDPNYEDSASARKHFDSDFNFNMEKETELDYDAEVTASTAPARACVTREQTVALLEYTAWGEAKAARSATHANRAKLDAYGLINHMVHKAMSAVSGGKPQLVLYSGHDRTLRALLAALGLTAESENVYYATRFIIEVYRRRQMSKERFAKDFCIRAVLNGDDVTKRMTLCRGWTNVADGAATLCPIENFVRFIIEDYFAPFNATNYRDACALR